MADLRRIVLDVLKPHEPTMLEFAERIAETDSVEGVSVSLLERDQDVQNVKLTVEGASLDYAAVEDAIDGLGGSVHSVDEVGAGDHVVEERPTPQDG